MILEPVFYPVRYPDDIITRALIATLRITNPDDNQRVRYFIGRELDERGGVWLGAVRTKRNGLESEDNE